MFRIKCSKGRAVVSLRSLLLRPDGRHVPTQWKANNATSSVAAPGSCAPGNARAFPNVKAYKGFANYSANAISSACQKLLIGLIIL